MALTAPQLTTLKQAILDDPALAGLPNDTDNNLFIAAAFNLAASPAFTVWRTRVTRQEILQNGFDWTRLDNLSVGKARIWTDIFVDGLINPSKANVRTGVEAVWVGTAQDLAVRAAVYVHCKRLATRGQKLFATGTGSDADPATMATNVEGSITGSDVETARNIP